MLSFLFLITFGYFALKGFSIMFTGGKTLVKENPEICKEGAKRLVRFLTK